MRYKAGREFTDFAKGYNMKKTLFLFIINSLFISLTVVAYAGEKVYRSDIAVLMDDMPVESVVINDQVYFEVSDEGVSYKFKLYDRPLEKLISFCEIDENEQK